MSPSLGNYCPQVWGIIGPAFGEFLSPSSGELVSPILGVFDPIFDLTIRVFESPLTIKMTGDANSGKF